MTEQLKITISVAALFCASVAIGVLGFLIEHKSFSDAFYGSIQLLVLEGNFDDVSQPLNWQLQFARFVLPLFTVLAVIGLLFSLAAKKITLIRANLFTRDTVFIGAGRTARAIARNFHKDRRLLVIDCAGADAFLSTFDKPRKPLLIIGDANERRLLASLSLQKSKDIYIFTGNDHQDLNIALILCELLPHHHTNGASLPRLIIDIDDAVLLNTGLQDERISGYRSNGGELIWFSTQRQSARELLRQQPVLTGSSIGKNSIHVALVGFGDFQQQVLCQILRTAVYLHARTLCISIFDSDTANFNRFKQLHPVLAPDFSMRGRMADLLPLANLEFFETNLDAAQPDVLQKALTISGAQHIDCVYVHDDIDYAGLNKSQRFLQSMVALNVTSRVICALSGSHLSNKEIAQRFVEAASANYQGIQILHCRDALIQTGEHYPGEHADRTGLKIHTAYVALSRAAKAGTSPWDNFEDQLLSATEEATREWRTSLSPAFMWSSRNAADHLSIKLRELGFEWPVDMSPIEAKKDLLLEDLQSAILDHLPALMELEHRRFIAERLVDGWLYGEETNKALRINNTLIAYQQLPEHEQAKDEAMIRVIPGLIRAHP